MDGIEIAEELEILHVNDDGMVCIKCRPCKKDRVVKASKGNHFIKVRCKCCFRITPFKINWRKGRRKKYGERAVVGKTQVVVFDLSLGGLSFDDKKINVLPGTKIKIKLPLVMTKGVHIEELLIEIVSRGSGRYGAKFMDLYGKAKIIKAIGFWLRE